LETSFFLPLLLGGPGLGLEPTIFGLSSLVPLSLQEP